MKISIETDGFTKAQYLDAALAGWNQSKRQKVKYHPFHKELRLSTVRISANKTVNIEVAKCSNGI